MSNHQKKHASGEVQLKETDCHPDRKTTGSLNNKEGEIFLLDNVNYGIRYKGGEKQLLPCNLPAALKKEGQKIIFSGDIKETGLEELWAGEPFVLTRIAER